MKILICADSHGDTNNIKCALEYDKFDYVFFIGDGLLDILQFNIPTTKLKLVLGNNDESEVVKDEALLELENKRIYLVHGHQFKVKYGVRKLVERAEELNADIVIFAHTHIPLQTKLENGMILLNPGSIAQGKLGNNTFMILELDDVHGIIKTNLYSI